MTAYIGVPLTTNPDQLTDEALDTLTAAIPGFVPREGHLEVILIEVLARMVAEARDVASSVPTTIFRYFGATLLGLPPTDAAAAAVATTWTMIDNLGYTIPAGTLAGFQVAGDEVIAFKTTADLVIAPGATQGVVDVEAVETGADSNGLGPGGMVLIDALAFVQTVTANAASAGGVDAESDEDYLDRLADELRLLSPRPILPADFAVMARRVAEVERALALDGYNPTEISGIHLPGTAGSFVSTPDAAAFDIVGDIDIRVQATLDDWTPAAEMALAAKWATAGNQRSYMLAVEPSGVLRLSWSADGAATLSADSTAATGVVDGAKKWVRATLDVDNGAAGRTVTFYTSDDGATWTQLGAPVTTAGVTSIFSGAGVVELGSTAAGTTRLLRGTIHYAEVRSGIGGAAVGVFDATGIASTDSTQYAGPLGNLWTLNGVWTWVMTAAATGNERMITVAVVNAAGGQVSNAGKTDVQQLLDEQREVNFTVWVIGPTYTTVNVTYVATAKAGYEPALVAADVQDALEAYINAATWAGGDADPPEWRNESTVRYLEVASVINNVAGIDYITNLTLNAAAADVTLAGPAALPLLGVLNGTVNAP